MTTSPPESTGPKKSRNVVIPTDGLWLDDLHVGMKKRTDSYLVTSEEIIAFATAWDPQPFHLSEKSARDTFFQGLAASGWMTAAITMRLLVTSGLPLAGGLIGRGGQVAWPSATRPGDDLHVELEVTDVMVSKSRPDRGFITVTYDTVNQSSEVRQHSTANVMAFVRPE